MEGAYFSPPHLIIEIPLFGVGILFAWNHAIWRNDIDAQRLSFVGGSLMVLAAIAIVLLVFVSLIVTTIIVSAILVIAVLLLIFMSQQNE